MKHNNQKKKLLNDKRYLELQEEFNLLNQHTDEGSSTSEDADLPDECRDMQKNVFKIQFAKSDNVEYPSDKFVITGLDFINYVSADDLYVLCNSFLPEHGSIQSVSVYQSNYGRKQLFDEQRNGPNFDRFLEAAFNQVIKDDKKMLKQYKKQQNKSQNKNQIMESLMNSNIEFNKAVSDQKLRLYNNDRLTWYIAIVIVDSTSTAETVFNQIDGQEYESLGQYIHCSELTEDVFQDLMSQDKYTVLESKGGYLRSECTQLPLRYQSFTNHIQYTKAKILMDEADGDRKKFFKLLKQGIDVSDEKVSKYLNLNSSSSESGEEDEASEKVDNKIRLQMARKALLAANADSDDSSEKQSSESSSENDQMPFQMNFESAFGSSAKKISDDHIQTKNSDKIEWQYRTGAEKSGPVAKKTEQKSAPLNTRNFFKKLLKHIEREDNPQMIRNLMKKKENLIKQYPDLQEFDKEQQKYDVQEDERFNNIDDLM